MAYRTIKPDPVPQHVTTRLRAVLKDETGAPVPGGQLSSLLLTVYSLDDLQTIVNSISQVNILNVGRGSVDNNGVLVVTLDGADNPVLDDTLELELHRALIEWTWANGTKSGLHEIEFPVANIAKVA